MTYMKPCASFAFGVGSVLSISPNTVSNELPALSEITVLDTHQQLKQHWQNVGKYINQALNQIGESNEQN